MEWRESAALAGEIEAATRRNCARLGAGDQELVRRYILEPRNHLRNSTDRLLRVMEVADVRTRENRRPD